MRKLPDYVIEDGNGWFVFTCTGCGTQIRFGPNNEAPGTERFRLAQLEAQDGLHDARWSSTLKCPRCQAHRRTRQSKV